MAAYVSVFQALIMIVFVMANGVPLADKRKKRDNVLEFADCGNENKIIYFHQVHAAPVPVIIPGTLYVTISGNLTADLPRRVNVYLKLKKYFFGFPFAVPCLATGIGSCSYENVCASLEQFETNGCPRPVRHLGFPCHCPFIAGDFSVEDVPIPIPKVQGFASTLLNGDYELELRITEEDGDELGCLHVKFAMKKRHKTWNMKI